MSASRDILPTLGPHVPLREATAYGVGPKYLIRDRDGKFGMGFARLAQTSHIEILKTPYYTPRANAICEWFLLSVRHECLDHLLVFHEKRLHRVLGAYVHYAQLSQTASRDHTADSRATSCANATRFRRRKGPLPSDSGWAPS